MNIFISTQCLCSKILIILEAYMEEIIQEFTRLQKNHKMWAFVCETLLHMLLTTLEIYIWPLGKVWKSERTAKCLVSRRSYGVGCIY